MRSEKLRSTATRTKSTGSQRAADNGPPTKRVDQDRADAILAGLEAGFAQDPAAPAHVAVALGSGAKVLVERGHLVVRDGEGWYRRDRRWNRATGGLRRLIV